MNKKGFTLVELLAVIVLLGIVTTLVATKGFGLFGTAKDKISDQNKKAVEEAAKLILVEVEDCQDELKDYEELKKYFSKSKNNSSIDSCTDLKSTINDSTIDLSDMITNGIVTGNDLENIDGSITINYDVSTNKGSIRQVNISERKINVYTFVSNNQNKNNTTAQTTLTFTPKEDGTLSFEWEVDSETGFDKLNITLNSAILVNNESGKEQKGNITENLTKNKSYTLIMQYTKDGSQYKFSDTATIRNLKINPKLKEEIKITYGAYKFVKQ